MLISDFDYDLPEELIAQQPLDKRDASRMLVLNRGRRTFQDSSFASLADYLRPEDLLVLNNTKVFPARLQGKRVASGGSVELLLLREIEPKVWEALARPARRLRPGAKISFGARLLAEVIDEADHGRRVVRFESDEPLDEVINEIGQTPLPPYIKRDSGEVTEDRERYQTVYASQRGAIAAPTAGLHFTPQILEQLKAGGIQVAEITLHVGYGTFEPVSVNDIANHRVAPEYFSISSEVANQINRSRSAGGRVICVGTTTARALESSAAEDGQILPGDGAAGLTIVPGYRFRAVDVLLTNFHLPRSSLLLLVSAFAGRELVLDAYRHAVRERYRFYSFGDSMLII
ncbi:MAG TPA: tRNA preQ1(34) S-adenosylmethionine ribosyltransferase-isomerase QueA [Pyrinomonadaceae bacterium]|nr:tRNA preQ1(34) S-adenosylmethionine ribosyltransferase-isomerase QueA [Pyrinomonadaceae bacterium]